MLQTSVLNGVLPQTLTAGLLYPFERFTADAKGVLKLAQEEAEQSRHSYIGTEHLLLGILRGQGPGHQALVDLGIDISRVREAIAAVLGRNERIIIQQTIPTSRVKKVIEISFEEARRMGQSFVNSGHLLLGLVIEGEGIAAHVLQDLGADAVTVTAAVENLMGESRPAGEASRLLNHPRVVVFMRGKDIADMQGLVARLAQPPEAIVKLQSRLAELRGQERDVRRELEQAEDDWLRSLTE